MAKVRQSLILRCVGAAAELCQLEQGLRVHRVLELWLHCAWPTFLQDMPELQTGDEHAFDLEAPCKM